MDTRTAGLLLQGLGVHMAAGAIFALPFVLWGAARIDPAASRASRGFRMAILPGVVIFWPWLAWHWLRGYRKPPEQRDSQRRAARGEA